MKNNYIMPGPLRVLIVEDSLDDTLLIAAQLERVGLDKPVQAVLEREVHAPAPAVAV